MIYQLPVAPVPNQFFMTSLDGETWQITIETRLDNLFISLKSQSRGLVLSNRICLDKTHIGFGFVFVDIEGDENPTYELLNSRYLLLWSDEYE